MLNSYGRIFFPRPSESSGFFSNYFSALSTMEDCITKKLIPYVDSTDTWFNPTCDFEKDLVLDSTINPWNWWFVQEVEKGATFVDVKLNRGAIPQAPSIFLSYPTIPRFKEISKAYCKIQPRILEEEEQLYKKYLADKNTLGILARGTEMLAHHKEYPKVNAQEWPKIINFVLNHHPEIDNIFLVSDDSRILKSIIDAFPKTKYLEHFFRSTNQTEEKFLNAKQPWWLESPIGDPNHRKRLGEECLIQTRLLARCNYYLGCYSGMNNAVNFFVETPFKASYLT